MTFVSRNNLSKLYHDMLAGCLVSSSKLLDVAKKLIHAKYNDNLDLHEIDDLVQNTFVKIIKSNSFDENKASFSTWILLIAGQEYADYLRKKTRRSKKHENFYEESSAVSYHQKSLDDIAMSDLIGNIDRFCAENYPDMQHFFYLHYFKGLSIDKCSLALQIPAGTLKSKSSRIYKKMQQNFQTSS